MSDPEKITFKPEQHEAPLTLPTAAEAEPLRSGEADPAKAIETARQNVIETAAEAETQPNPLEALQAAEKASRPATPSYINRELKQITLQRELQRLRRQLPAPQRLISRVIHQPAIRTVSQAAGQTVSRPSGLLGGGLVAFVGSSGYLYLSRHIGFTYNYLVFMLLLGGGFILGLGLELLVHLATRSRRGDS